eukprot:scaffold12670_cov119-Isochrysis_galbana.AAC.2
MASSASVPECASLRLTKRAPASTSSSDQRCPSTACGHCILTSSMAPSSSWTASAARMALLLVGAGPPSYATGKRERKGTWYAQQGGAMRSAAENGMASNRIMQTMAHCSACRPLARVPSRTRGRAIPSGGGGVGVAATRPADDTLFPEGCVTAEERALT